LAPGDVDRLAATPRAAHFANNCRQTLVKRIIRIVGFALALLLLFLVAVVFSAGWLKRQNDRLRADTLKSRAAQFAEVLEIAHAGPPPWPDTFTQQLAQALDIEIVLLAATAAPPPPPIVSDTATWSFTHVIRNADGTPASYALVRLNPSPTVRAMLMLQRLSTLLLFLALMLVLALVLLVILDRRWLRTLDIDLANSPGPSESSSDFGMLSHLAERSVRQSAELEQEREERQRAEADGHLKQILLNRALQEKIDMGRDLHDGLIQSLYATGLTIQASRKAFDADPATARSQIDTALQTLNTAIREVRTYISGLGPEQLRQRSFADSVRAIVNHLAAGREIETDLRIDEEAAHSLAPSQLTDLLQIVREAVSNSLRHGGARHISIRLHRNGEELCLSAQDDGRGFDPHHAVRGHGLDNMQARADRLDAHLRCQSEPGRGARITLTFNVPTSHASP
jgi:signal transduction histidine kinase